jgi:DNA-binding LacI/PurR family transcriptional regulator
MWTEGNWSSKSGKVAFLDLIEKFPEMDGIFVGNDQMALSVLLASKEIGKKVPEELSVIGFDGIADSEFYCPPLSTVSQNLDELGRRAVDVLITQIEQKSSGAMISNYSTIQPELIIRKSD